MLVDAGIKELESVPSWAFCCLMAWVRRDSGWSLVTSLTDLVHSLCTHESHNVTLPHVRMGPTDRAGGPGPFIEVCILSAA